ncbi:DUF4097 family beta strand repeat-containing protein [Anaerosporobacter faecicola]|uniref:DUF4097 family beta strand repeat-containing protein n=1 Tax=Anaerosporobacter faecicola TaxID=2718714 RepID=UPI00143C2598|nr:DUF4097 family beta strand repeat-containing protein [Anaerosporobacter faecicola]
MNKERYLSEIKKALVDASVDQGIIEEVISDYEEHFRMGMKNGKIEEEICEELGSIEEIVAEIRGMEGNNKPNEKKEEKYSLVAEELQNEQKQQEAGNTSMGNAPFTKVQVEGVCADVQVFHGPEFQVNYMNNGSEKDKLAYQFYHYQEGDTMYVGVKENFTKMLFRIFHTTNIRLDIQMPDFVEDLKVKLVSGDCRLEGVQLQKLAVNTASGDITMNQVSAIDGEIHSSSGDLRVDSSRISHLYAKSSSGDVTAMYVTGNVLRCNSSSGDLGIDGGTIDRIEAHTSSGDVKCSALAKDYFMKSVSGDVVIHMMGDGQATFESVSGDVEILLNNQKNGFILNANTVSGDVNLNYGGMYQSDCKSGHYTFGNQGATINAKTVSGDIDLKG